MESASQNSALINPPESARMHSHLEHLRIQLDPNPRSCRLAAAEGVKGQGQEHATTRNHIHCEQLLPSEISIDMAEGLAFFPQDHELVDLFLCPKLAGQPLRAGFVHDVDVYSAAPDQLVVDRTSAPGTGVGDARVWYFFSPVRHCTGKRKARTVDTDGKEWWHSEAGQKTVKGSAAGGCFQKFSYKVKTASGVVKPGWLMVEYSIDGADLVLCKVYRSPRAPPLSRASSAALSESGCKKRKAADHDHPEAPPSVRPQWTNEELPLQEIERSLISDDPYFLTDLPEGVPLRAHIFWPEILRGLSSDDPVPVGVDDADLDEYTRYLFGDLLAVPPCAPIA